MRHPRRWQAISVIAATLLAGLTAITVDRASSGAADTDCALRYVAGGDGVVHGTHAESKEADRYSRQLLEEHLKKQDPTVMPGPWCEYNTSKDPTTTDQYVTEGSPTQQAEAWNKRPRLITLTLGRQNSTIVDQIDSCFKNIKDHDFLEANACALKILASQDKFDELRKDLSETLNTFKIQMDGNPQLVVAVTGYFNPYNSATSVATKIPGFCTKLQDTIPTCIARWVLLPPALVTLDQVVKQVNTTVEGVLQRFTQASQGRFVFVNPYDKFKDHCMEMQVEIKTKVYHPTNTVHDHNTSENFGCSDTWIASDGKPGQKSPFIYLTPAVTGLLIQATQKTEKMGFNPNEKGHDCLAQLIWEKTKNKLGVPEKPKPDSEVCSNVS